MDANEVGEESESALRRDLFSYLRSSVGSELLHRLAFICLSRTARSDCLSLEETGLLVAKESRGLMSRIASLYITTGYGCPGGIVSSSLERSESFLTSLSLESSCNDLFTMRRVLVTVDRLFFQVKGRGVSEHRCLRPGGDVNWQAALALLSDTSIDFQRFFCHPELMSFIRGIRSSGTDGLGYVVSNVGPNFLRFLLLFCSPLCESEEMVDDPSLSLADFLLLFIEC